MNKSLRAGNSSELIVAGELVRRELDVYLPVVDDQAIDLVLRAESREGVRYYDVQVKSVKGYNRIVGVRDIENKPDGYILIIHYRHDKREDEFFYLEKEQILRHYSKDSDWGDLAFNKPEREDHANQDLTDLAMRIRTGNI